jgi:hypothetical protein
LISEGLILGRSMFASTSIGSRAALTLVGIAAALISQACLAQKLPPPSRTVYKCEVDGKVTYSDEPCLGAKRIDVEPTRGLNKSTGVEQMGRDVQHERRREGIAEALRPLTGMDAKQYNQLARRHNLPAAAQKECRILDQAIPDHERMEVQGAGVARQAATRKLFILRSRAKELNC